MAASADLSGNTGRELTSRNGARTGGVATVRGQRAAASSDCTTARKGLDSMLPPAAWRLDDDGGVDVLPNRRSVDGGGAGDVCDGLCFGRQTGGLGDKGDASDQPRAAANSSKIWADRISKLGDAVLGRVLSFLSSKEVARAAALSSPWRGSFAGGHAVSLEEKERPVPD
ncbi:hypothetical protein QYE76_009120 [Lolium multiflorum]|uniref:F-box domain-containing protein n=1 Tax=Lolium multiflorum TaxID=4521 RepID=A0AAD8TUG8_LOLMU|nr:hypothetical protein QYE76_009120 [Lolium multiflorum]